MDVSKLSGILIILSVILGFWGVLTEKILCVVWIIIGLINVMEGFKHKSQKRKGKMFSFMFVYEFMKKLNLSVQSDLHDV